LASQVFDINQEYDFDVMGLTCQEKDYRLVWAINLELGWRLEREQDHKVIYKTHQTLHSRYIFFDEENGRVIRLLVNRGEGGALLPELHGIDSVLILEGFEGGQITELMTRLRKISFLLACIGLDLNKIKSKYNLLTD
jgi:hypothetical protein